jgi:excisionase family DNA binding protein
MPPTHFLTAKQAADALGVTRATLYAYTSRGQLRSEPVPGHTRRALLSRGRRRLKERKVARRDPAKAPRTDSLGRTGSRVGHHAHSRRHVLLPRPR